MNLLTWRVGLSGLHEAFHLLDGYGILKNDGLTILRSVNFISRTIYYD